MPTITQTDHRSRVAHTKRERMRERLIESAMRVFANNGFERSVIDDVISEANVSRGTFYNYFKTNDELLEAISASLSDEVIAMIETEVNQYKDPAQRLSTGLRLYLQIAQQHEYFARFICAAGVNISNNSLAYEYLPQHLEQAIEKKLFSITDIGAALDLVAGTILFSIFRITAGDTPPNYPDVIVTAVLMGLGMPEANAKKLVQLPIKPFSPNPNSLIGRSYIPAENSLYSTSN